jgi:Ca2+/Na+ antiporter
MEVNMGIIIPLVLIFFTCLFIWRACDGFEVASEYIGRNMSEGVRGGTINAISSSVPELFTTLIALFLLSDQDGFAVGIGTTAGSALFNGMIIPAVCILAVVGTVVAGKRVNSVNVGKKVILRDGLSLILCEAILVIIISGTTLHWWQGLVLMMLYFAYFWYMISSMTRGVRKSEDADEEDEEDGPKSAAGQVFYWLSLGPILDLEGHFIKAKHRGQIKAETWNGWPLLLSSTAVIGGACYMLVKACEWLGHGKENPYHLFGHELIGLGMPTLFVAVIFASMATSVPDTVISLRDARDGDYDDAVANALGSNIFDICFALGFPLFLFTLINGPIVMSPDIVAQSGELRLLLLALTVLGFCVYYFGRQGVTDEGYAYIEMRKPKAFMLLAIYIIFVGYVLARSAGEEWALVVSAWLQSILEILPKVGG